MAEAMMENARQNKGTFYALGIILVILGILAIVLPGAALLALNLLIGALLVVVGIVVMVGAFRMRKAGGFASSFILGLLALIIGILLLVYPLAGMVTLGTLLMVYLIVGGILKMAFGFQVKGEGSGWGWIVFAGIISLILGILMLAYWPIGTVWVTGLLIGIDIMFTGWILIMLPMASKG